MVAATLALLLLTGNPALALAPLLVVMAWQTTLARAGVLASPMASGKPLTRNTTSKRFSRSG